MFHFANHENEIAHLAQRIQSFVKKDGIPPGQIIVLCQSREYVRGLYQALQDANIPTEFCYLESQFDEEGATERMAMLNLAADQDDRVALRYLMGYGSNDWRTGQWSKIRSTSVAEGKSPWQILTEMAAGTRSAKSFSSILTHFRAVQAQLTSFAGLKGVDLVNAWLPAGSACKELRALADSVVAAKPTCDSRELSESILEMVTEPDIPDLVSDVRIMSLHKSKGLSANVVIIAGCVEGLIPRQPDDDFTDAQKEEAIEESRRLFFVGLTRVKASPKDGRPGHLILSASRNVPNAIAMRSGIAVARKWFAMAQTITSRFLGELGPDSPAPVNPV